MTRTSLRVTVAATVVTLGLGGWAAAGALRPPPSAAPAGDTEAPGERGLQVRYEVRREAPYLPPPATEATRLDVLNPSSPTTVEEGVLSAQAGEALRSQQAEDASRTASALAALRAQDARIDRETASALDGTGDADVAPVSEASSPPTPTAAGTKS